jgi:uncharacterized pyridoxamine 5'-phosphate oxidase family protein
MENNVYQGIAAYRIYLAVRSHFNSSYDYFKYDGKLKVKDETFLKRNDRLSFAILERKYKKNDLIEMMFVNFLYDKKTWAKTLGSKEAENKWMEWRKQIEAASHTFKGQCNIINDHLHKNDIHFNKLLKVEDGHPVLINLFITNEVTIFTLMCFDKVFGIFDIWKRDLGNDIIYEQYIAPIVKCRPLINRIDKTKLKTIMREIFK